MANGVNTNVSGWVGWVYFAGIILVIRGFLQGISGLVALLNNKVFVIGEESLTVLNFTAWGWVHLAIGVLVLAAGMAILNGAVWGRVVGVLVTGLALIANMTFLTAYPVWSVLAIVLDVVIIYALTVHGGEAKNA